MVFVGKSHLCHQSGREDLNHATCFREDRSAATSRGWSGSGGIPRSCGVFSGEIASREGFSLAVSPRRTIFDFTVPQWEVIRILLFSSSTRNQGFPVIFHSRPATSLVRLRYSSGKWAHDRLDRDCRAAWRSRVADGVPAAGRLGRCRGLLPEDVSGCDPH